MNPLNRLLAVSVLLLLSAQAQFAWAQATNVVCDKCVNTSDIALDAITSNRIKNGAIRNADIAPDSIGGSRIKNGTLTNADIAPNSISGNRIKNGSIKGVDIANDTVDIQNVVPALRNDLGSRCPLFGDVVVGKAANGTYICVRNVPPATCAELEFDGQLWGVNAAGLDLRKRTNSTLHFIGCLDGLSSCAASTFYCIDDPQNGTITFGTTAPAGPSDTMRALIDPGNANRSRNTTPTTVACCSASVPNNLCNSPITASSANALCVALGYSSGVVTEVVNENTCPKADDFSAGGDGRDWSSAFVGFPGYGRSYTCFSD